MGSYVIPAGLLPTAYVPMRAPVAALSLVTLIELPLATHTALLVGSYVMSYGLVPTVYLPIRAPVAALSLVTLLEVWLATHTALLVGSYVIPRGLVPTVYVPTTDPELPPDVFTLTGKDNPLTTLVVTRFSVIGLPSVTEDGEAIKLKVGGGGGGGGVVLSAIVTV